MKYTNLTALITTQKWYISAGAYHAKRGFKITDASPVVATNHLIEETVEFQAEVIVGNKDKILEEAGDVLGLLLHNLAINNLSIEEVAQQAYTKLLKVWVINPAEIKTNTPGFNRSNR